ncbi:MAG: PAS domain-containing protein [Bauldia sp.]|nr:PAS domain-containing protein [Bauldia sp.]
MRPDRPGLSILLGILVGAIGFAVNLSPVRSGFGLELLFGGIGTFFLMRVGDRVSALLAAILSSAATLVVWGEPAAFALILGEACFCLYFLQRRRLDPLVASPIYWLVIGVPVIAVYYGLVLGDPSAAVVARGASRVVNALANVALGSLLASLAMAAVPLLRSRRSRSMRIAIVEVLVAFTIMPVVLYSAFAAPGYQYELEASAEETVTRAAKDAAQRAETLIAEIRRETSAIGHRAFAPGVIDTEAAIAGRPVPYAVERIFIANHRRELIASLSSTGVVVYADGAVRLPDLGTTRLRDQVDEYGRAVPVISVELIQNEVMTIGWAVAVVEADRFRNYVLPAEAPPHVAIGVVSGRGGVVVSTGPAVSGTEDDGHLLAVEPLTMGGWQIEARYDADAFATEYRERSAQFLGLMVLIVGLGVLASTIAASLITRPLENLARAIARQGQPGAAAPVMAGVTEADALARAVEVSRAEADRYTQENKVLALRLASLVAHAPVKIYAAELRDGDFTVAYASPGLSASLGLDLEPGGPFAAIDQRLHPADRRRVLEERGRLTETDRFESEYRVVRPSGETIWIAEVAVLVRDADGQPREIVGVVMDVTNRKLADLRMQQSAKLINLGQMATGLAHELNQPLNVIGMAAENAMFALDGGAEGREVVWKKLSRIEAQVQRASRLVDHLRIFGRMPDDNAAPFAVEGAVKAALSMVESQIRLQGVQLVASLSDPDAVVTGAAQRLEQVVINIALNALDAVVARARAAEPSIETPTPYGRIAVDVRRDPVRDVVRIEIADNGGGIAPDVFERVFEPFVTTKPPGAGTGLGLSLSFGIVTEMGGTLTAENRGAGAVFTIELPLADMSIDGADRARNASPVGADAGAG